jgi:hypothetical protein
MPVPSVQLDPGVTAELNHSTGVGWLVALAHGDRCVGVGRLSVLVPDLGHRDLRT